ncbi:MAG: 16S rRNA (uracil(1498)-N(3))-methyltransferase [bacterium]
MIKRVEGRKAFLNENEIHHLTKVFRARRGDTFEGLDAEGRKYRCELAQEEGRWFGMILASLEETSESPFRIALAQALIKKNKFEWVIQKAVELGVTEIIPIETERTEIRLSGERKERRVLRWRRIIDESVKQSGRNTIPALPSPVSLDRLLDQRSGTFCVVMDEAGGADFRSLLGGQNTPSSCLVLIGPEGGWGDCDRRLFSSHSTVSINLGPRILRAETASVVALSLLQYELGDLGGFQRGRHH